ncbi:MAG: hypothetical protein MMC23_000606 [Stictis urceolatum]|nr:hypothetical protein [Stictis urceolata]
MFQIGSQCLDFFKLGLEERSNESNPELRPTRDTAGTSNAEIGNLGPILPIRKGLERKELVNKIEDLQRQAARVEICHKEEVDELKCQIERLEENQSNAAQFSTECVDSRGPTDSQVQSMIERTT